MKLQSFDPRLTLALLKSKDIDPKKWDKIQHLTKSKIVLYRNTGLEKEIKTLNV